MKPQLVRAPAKVNLLLLVGPLQPDGYHPLLSVMAPLTLADELEVDLTAEPHSPADDGSCGPRPSPGVAGGARRVVVTCPGVALGANLVDRAVDLVESETGWILSGSIAIRKRIPMAAGMGGGSSDAAAALIAAAEAVRVAGGPPLARGGLAQLAARLGADVPFFLTPGCSLARGRGEVLEPFRLPRQYMVLVLPEEQLSTRAVYAAYDTVAGNETAAEFHHRCEDFELAWRDLETRWLQGEVADQDVVAEVGEIAHNDLESAAYCMVPDLTARQKALKASGAHVAMMSGSGPTMFGLYPSEQAAVRAAVQLEKVGYQVVYAEVEEWQAAGVDPSA